MDIKKSLPVIVLVILAVAAIGIRRCSSNTNIVKPTVTTNKDTTHKTNNTTYSARGLNRNPSHINYSKHARCRMDCRHVTENEVEEILKDGKINYTKSELQGDDCNKKYAVEGISKDNQKLRIIFAPCNDEETVVTVIDLGTEWPCNCE